MNPLPLIEGALFVDNSFLESFTTCPRACEYSRLAQRTSAEDKPSLTFGSAIHLALEYRYKVYQNRQPDALCESKQVELLTKFFEENPNPLDDYRNLNWAHEVVKRYNQRYNIEEFQLLRYEEPQKCSHCDGTGYIADPLGGIGDIEQTPPPPCPFCSGGHITAMVEMPFALKLSDWKGHIEYSCLPCDFPCSQVLETHHSKVFVKIPIYYSGRIDLPVCLDGQIFILDHKTTSQLGPQFWERSKMSAQQPGYCWAFEQITGMKTAGYMINAIRVKEPPKWLTDENSFRTPRGKVQSPEQWWDESLVRERFYLGEDTITEWKHNAIEQINTFFYHYQRGYFPKHNPMSCTMFGRCSYYDVCDLPLKDRGLMLESGKYMDNTWSPLTKTIK